MTNNLSQPQATSAQAELAIQRIYTKNLSLESPQSPEIFLNPEWKPEIKLDLHTRTTLLAENIHEVILRVTITAQLGDKVGFLIEVEQAGIFSLVNFPAEQLGAMLGSYCPNILFPYVREAVSDVIVRAGFPQFYLAPINFDNIYAQHLQQNQGNLGNTNIDLVSETTQ